MKKIIQHICLLLAGFSLLQGCTRTVLKPDINALNIGVYIKYNEADGVFNFPLKAISVKMGNLWNNKVQTGETNETGIAQFPNISAGEYDISATITIKKDDYFQLTGQKVIDDVTFNASVSKRVLNNRTTDSIHLTLASGLPSALVIKQIYYAGSHSTNGASFRDQFIEIYNNSDEVVYADSLYVVQLAGLLSTNPDMSTGKFVTGGELFKQYDWNKSIGMSANGKAVTDYVYAKSLYRIPGNGTDYPIQPGKSIVIAQTAVNHKAPFASTTGGTISVKDPSLTVDLSNADFEVYLAPYLASPLNSDVDNPAVPNMIMLDYTGKDWILDNLGRDAFAIFKTTEDVAATWKKYPNPTVLSITGSTVLQYQISNSVLMDAVETMHNTPASRVPKKLLNHLDAGFAICPAGGYSSQSVIRKSLIKTGGRIVLRDTNNSSNDFEYMERAEPGAFKPLAP